MDRLKILLVEDNEGDILLISEAFEDLEFPIEIYCARDGREAVEFLKFSHQSEISSIPDLVLLDINLPFKNGQEVLKFIRGSDKFRKLPVIMLTTSSSQKDINESYKNHANSYIVKPFGSRSYYDILESIRLFWFSMVELPAKM